MSRAGPLARPTPMDAAGNRMFSGAAPAAKGRRNSREGNTAQALILMGDWCGSSGPTPHDRKRGRADLGLQGVEQPCQGTE